MNGSPLRAVTKVALVDDQPVIRAGLRTLLQSDPSVRVVGEFHDVPVAA
jgi:DNA-binding NarL/FixJ family response regulator